MPVAEKEELIEQNIVTETLDMLDRQPFVEQMIRVANMLADNKKNSCYAINGGWGVGKTYVLDMFEKRIRDYGQEGTTLGKFLVFHYNCWQYDYYEEPLIAIVSAMMDAIDEEVCLLSAETKTVIKAALREIAKDFLNEANSLVKQKTGIDIKKWFAFWKTAKEENQHAVAEAHNFDTYFEFKKKLAELKRTIGSLSNDQTVIFVVDELDRCLPEYVIKVLERLHHIFDDIPNLQVVLSVDKRQLENTVSQIYGSGTNVDTYLAKFIDFEIYLDEGVVKDNFARRFSSYMKNFTIVWEETKAMDVDKFTSRLLGGIGTRQRIALVEKCEMIHNMVSDDKTMDISIMCIELFLALVQSCGLDLENGKRYFNTSDLFIDDERSTHPVLHKSTDGLRTIGNWYHTSQAAGGRKYLQKDPNIDRTYIECRDLWGVILGVYRYVIGFENDYWMTGRQDQYAIKEHVDKFWGMLEVIN